MTREELHEAWANARFRAKCKWHGYIEVLWNDRYITGWDWPKDHEEEHRNWYEEMEDIYG